VCVAFWFRSSSCLKMAALASLTANYTDSEDEQSDKEEAKAATSAEETAKGAVPERLRPASATPASTPASGRSTPTKKMRLVSYAEEGEGDKEEEDEEEPARQTGPESADEEATSESFPEPSASAEDDLEDKFKTGSDDEAVPMDLDSENDGGAADEEDAKPAAAEKGGEDGDGDQASLDRSHSAVEVESWTDGVQLPPEPKEKCSTKLQEKINALYRRKVETGYDMNAVIQNRKAFRNPSIYEKLIQYCDIDETGTNLPKELYDGHLFGKESAYDELAKVQAVDMERREKAAKSRKSAEEAARDRAAAVMAAKKPALSSAGGVGGEEGKRRSTWAQAAPAARPPTNPNVPMPNKPAPQLVSASSGAASSSSASSSKTISAFGPLRK